MDFANMKPSDRTKLAAEALENAFAWDDQPEGEAFWVDVYDKLTEIADHQRRFEAGMHDEPARKPHPCPLCEGVHRSHPASEPCPFVEAGRERGGLT